MVGNLATIRASKYIDEFITRKARQSEGWAIAYALLELGKCITGAGSQIGGVDDFTGIMRVGGSLEWIARTLHEKERGNGSKEGIEE
jgi:hypothetical protein